MAETTKLEVPSTEEDNFSGRVALVTGASRGIGEAIATRLGEAGAYIVGSATTSDGAKAITENLKEKGIEGFGVELDFLTLGEDQYKERVEAITEQAGKAVTILVNNAGITRDQLAIKMTPQEVTDVLKVDLAAPMLLTLASLRGMVKARKGDIVNIGSVVGTLGEAGQANYAAAKAGLVGFTKSLAKEYGERGLRANLIAPGYVDTDMTRVLPQERIDQMLQIIPSHEAIQPEQIAVIAELLVQFRHLNGEVIAADGGLTPNSVI